MTIIFNVDRARFKLLVLKYKAIHSAFAAALHVRRAIGRVKNYNFMAMLVNMTLS